MQGLVKNEKRDFLEKELNANNITFACFCETWFKNQSEIHHTDDEVNIENYKVYRSDRQNGNRGGVCVYLREDLMATTLVSESINHIEILLLKIEKLDLLLATIYRPPTTEKLKNTEIQAFKDIIQILDREIKKTNNNCNTIVCGDFNLPNINWNKNLNKNIKTGRSNEKIIGQLLQSFLDKHFLSQIIEKPTRKNNILELICTNAAEKITDIEISPTILSDHNIIRVETIIENISLKQNEKTFSTNENKFQIFDFNHEDANWPVIKQTLQTIDWKNKLFNEKVDDCLEKIEYEIINIIKDHIPLRKISKKRRSNTKRMKQTLFRRKHKTTKNLHKTKNETKKDALRTELENIENEILKSINNELQQKELKAVENINKNPKSFYSFAKKSKKSKTGIDCLQREDGSLTENQKEISNLLNESFKKSFSVPLPSKQIDNISAFFEIGLEINDSKENSILQDFNFTEKEMIEAINKTKTYSSPGPDGWATSLLLNCKEELAEPLCILWRKSLDTGNIPSNLKTANIAPIPKKGKRTLPQNYRPIALTSHIIKAFERVIRNVLQNFLETNNKLNEMQHAFRKGRSCLSQLIEHYDQIIDMLMDNYDVDVIYTDFAKAFDKCDHGIIANKLKQTGITGKLGRWIYNFLTNRTQKVIVNGIPSSQTIVPSSVPQGTVLAPVLFLIFINDLGEKIEHSTLGCFADDAKLYNKLKCTEDHKIIQQDCDNLFKWADENNALFNSEKFQLLRYGNNLTNRNELNYITPDGKHIDETGHARDLGIKMSNDATYDAHNIEMINKCKRLSSYILRTFKSRDSTMLLRLWKVLVIPIIEYCSILTSPYQTGQISKIEGLQRSFTAKMDLPPDCKNYYDRLKYLQIYSLQRRRERYTIMYTWKILEGIVLIFHKTK
jgi:hypothetical protein